MIYFLQIDKLKFIVLKYGGGKVEKETNVISCECGWIGNFKSILKEYEECCPTVLLFKCSGCKREIVSVNTVGNLHHANIPLISGAILSLSSKNDKYNDKRAIPRIEGKDKKRVALGIRVAYLNRINSGNEV